MLHVLIGQAGDPDRARISLKRAGDEIRCAVTLGPDTSATFETERAWLSRMAVRHGGRLELDGSMQTLVLAADVDTHRRELESLKKELAAAQAQGEAYARELAAVFNRPDGGGLPPSLSSSSPGRASHQPAGVDGLGVLVAALRALGADLRGVLSAIGRDVAPLRDHDGEVGEIAASVGRHVTAASQTVADLARLGACPIGELPRHANVAELLRDVVQSDVARAARQDVRVIVDAPEAIEDIVPAGALTVLLHALLDHAIDASPSGSQVTVTMKEDAEAGVVFTFDDAGAPIPPAARTGILSREFEVIAHGRSSGLSLIAALSIASHLRLPLELDDAPLGGTRVRLVLPRLATG